MDALGMRFQWVCAKWRMKAVLQRVLAQAPGGREMYFVGQRVLGGLRRFDPATTIFQGMTCLEILREEGFPIAGLRTAEIGTGWAPVLPFLFWACGQADCDTFDVSRLLKPRLIRTSCRALAVFFRNRIAEVPPRLSFSPAKLALLDAWASRPAGEVFARCAVRYHAPCDGARTGLPAGSKDLVFSKNVLEHVPRERLPGLFREAARILRPGGLMYHAIDLDDQFAHSEPGMSLVHFLRFSEEEFTAFNSCLTFQNRLRASAYRRLIEAEGFEILRWEPKVDERVRAELASIRLDPEFARLPGEDISTVRLRVLARKPGTDRN